MTGPDDYLVDQALKLLIAEPHHVLDAWRDRSRGNSVAGSVLAIIYGVPRMAAERAVRAALVRLPDPMPKVLVPVDDARADYPSLDPAFYWFLDRSGAWQGPYAGHEELLDAIGREGAS